MQRDLEMGLLTVDSELRRMSELCGPYGMEVGDLITVQMSGAYVKSSCIDLWSVVANKRMLNTKTAGNVFILTMPSSQAIFCDFISGSGDLDNLAKSWAQWKTPLLKHLLIPVNLNNEHWCLLVVNLESKSVFCWDSLYSYDRGEFVESKKENLFSFLRSFTGNSEGEWTLEIVFENVPQQTKADCGIFCIEFMRAFLGGCLTADNLEKHVQQSSIKADRQHIAREIKDREILQKGSAGKKRERKKPRNFGED